MIRRLSLASICLVLLVLAAAAGCQRETLPPDDSKIATTSHIRQGQLTAEQLTGRQGFPGNTPEAWLTDRGGNSDGGYCDAMLRLPLATEPNWEFDYSAAEFSPTPVRAAVHYNGTLYLAAESPQLIALNADDGTVIFNKDVYAHEDTDVVEQIQRIYAHPKGLLIGQDNLGRYYAWDTLGEELLRLWLGPELITGSGFVTDQDLLLTSLQDQLYALDVLTGGTKWAYPSNSRPGGVVLSRDGIELWWSSDGRLYALEAATGIPLWSITTTDLIERAVIDEVQSLAYVAYGSEFIECRSLADGNIRWSYSWAGLYSAEERARRFAEVKGRLGGRRQHGMNWSGTNNRVDDIALSGDGLALSLCSGHVVKLDATGRQVWMYSGQAPVTRLIAFNNGLLVGALYVRPEVFLWERAVFCLDLPDWPRMRQVWEEQGAPLEETAGNDSEPDVALQASSGDAGVRQEIFYRYAVLGLDNGQELSAFEPELLPASALIPAHGNVVYAEAPWYWAITGRAERSNRLRVLAYPWIEWEGEE